jgi:hypothetical protein
MHLSLFLEFSSSSFYSKGFCSRRGELYSLRGWEAYFAALFLTMLGEILDANMLEVAKNLKEKYSE